MNRYRITFVNPAFSPRASYEFVQATSPEQAAEQFRKTVNQACVVKTCGDRGIIQIDKWEGD